MLFVIFPYKAFATFKLISQSFQIPSVSVYWRIKTLLQSSTPWNNRKWDRNTVWTRRQVHPSFFYTLWQQPSCGSNSKFQQRNCLWQKRFKVWLSLSFWWVFLNENVGQNHIFKPSSNTMTTKLGVFYTVLQHKSSQIITN